MSQKLKSVPSIMLMCTLCCDLQKFWVNMYNRDENRKEIWKKNQLDAYIIKVKSFFDVMNNYFPNDIMNLIKEYLGEILEVQNKEKYLDKQIEGNKIGILQLFCTCSARHSNQI